MWANEKVEFHASLFFYNSTNLKNINDFSVGHEIWKNEEITGSYSKYCTVLYNIVYGKGLLHLRTHVRMIGLSLKAT